MLIEVVNIFDVQVWKCTTCYTMFHITCIQKWVKDGVYQQTATSDDDEVDAKSIPWHW